MFGGGAHRVYADFFDLNRYYVTTAGEVGCGFGVVEWSGEATVHDEARRA
jgi:hypothetical protein